MGAILGGGNALIERFQALDQSSAPFESQIREAFDFVGLELLDRKDLLLYRLSDDVLLSDYNAKDERILRWLLKKLGDGGANIEKAYLQHSSWLLFAQMTQKLSIKTLARLLQRFKFTDILRKALKETLECLTFKKFTDQEVAGYQEGSSTRHDATGTPNRNLTHGSEMVSTESVVNATTDVISLLWSISLALDAFHSKIDNHASGPGAFAAQNIKYVLQSSSQEAAEVLRDSFKVVLYSRAEFLLHLSLSNVFERVIEPFLKFWQIRKASPKSDSTRIEAVRIVHMYGSLNLTECSAYSQHTVSYLVLSFGRAFVRTTEPRKSFRHLSCPAASDLIRNSQRWDWVKEVRRQIDPGQLLTS